MHHRTDRPTPTLSPGVTLLYRPEGRSRALHRLVAGALDGDPALWVDARNRASTYALDEVARRGALAGLRIARAFTAYQHRTLVDRVVARAAEADLVVAPCTAALYRDDDVDDAVSRALLADAVDALATAAARNDVPVLLTATGDAPLEGVVADTADRTLTAVRTREGLRYEGAGADVYYRRDGFQTTIDYWVDLFGCVCDAAASRPDPGHPTAGDAATVSGQPTLEPGQPYLEG